MNSRRFSGAWIRALSAGALGLCVACAAPWEPTTKSIAPPVPAVGDLARLRALMNERAVFGTEANYRIGEGDELTVEVLGVNELAGKFRVSELGRIALPLVQPVAVEGLTVREAAKQIGNALGQYLQDPVVKLSVARRASALVAVMGAVRSPGSYPLEGFDETLGEVITRAGGVTHNAGPTMFLYPAGSGSTPSGTQIASFEPAGLIRAGAPPAANGVEIDLTRLYRGRSVPELSLPLREGDAILIPPAGEVFVNGWVERPGSYYLRTRTTLTGALADAGGLHFGASRGQIKIVRVNPSGRPEVRYVSYAEALSNTSQDPFLQAGDRLEVPMNPVRAAGWALYSGITSLVGFSTGGRIIPSQNTRDQARDLRELNTDFSNER